MPPTRTSRSRKALALSINDGDAIAALNIVDQLCHAYAVDDLDVRAQALTELQRKSASRLAAKRWAKPGWR